MFTAGTCRSTRSCGSCSSTTAGPASCSTVQAAAAGPKSQRKKHSPTWALLVGEQRHYKHRHGDRCRLAKHAGEARARAGTGVRARAGTPLLGDDERRCEHAGTSLVVIAALRGAGTSLLVADDCRRWCARARRSGQNSDGRSRGARSKHGNGAGSGERPRREARASTEHAGLKDIMSDKHGPARSATSSLQAATVRRTTTTPSGTYARTSTPGKKP